MLRTWLIVASGTTLALLFVPVIARSRPNDVRAERQAFLTTLLTDNRIEPILRDRLTCASGTQSTKIARLRTLGVNSVPDAADYCVTVLVRLAREGKLPPIGDNQVSTPTPAVALDTGFSAGYVSRNAPLGSLPAMATLRPIAERCLGQSEPNVRLCYSAGYAFGARTAQGETVRVP